MSHIKELSGYHQEEFERLHAEIRARWLSVEPKLNELAALAREMKSKRLYLFKFATYDDYAQSTFGRTGKAMDALVWRESQKEAVKLIGETTGEPIKTSTRFRNSVIQNPPTIQKNLSP